MDPTTILMLVALLAVMYFLLVRPAQTKAKEQQRLLKTIQPGARVMTTAGIFGTVREVGANQAIIEVSPGMDLTVLKQAIVRVVTDAEDEFEYADGAEIADEADAPLADAADTDAPDASAPGSEQR